MAAIDLPINDTYLSHVHQVRNANKAAARASRDVILARRQEFWLPDVDEEESNNAMASSSSSSERQVSGSAFDLRASDSAVLSYYPTPLLRLLVLLSPAIDVAVRFVQLATWTGGAGTASHSFMLVLGWWAVCLYGYEVVRYCPQFALLGLLSLTGIVRAFNASQGRPAKSTIHPTADLASAGSVNATIDNLAVLADFCSSFYTNLVAPLTALFCWHDVEQTFGLLFFLITSWPTWLLLFSGSLAQAWDILQLPALTHAIYSNAIQPLALQTPHLRGYLLMKFLSLQIRYPTLAPYLDVLSKWTLKTASINQQYIWPRLQALTAFIAYNAPDVLRLSAGPHLGFFPVLSLRVRHLLLVIGTIALTWCSPWCALIRHALWRSALVRRAVRFTWGCLSGQILYGRRGTGSFHAQGRLTLGPNGEPVALGTDTTDLLDEKTAFGSARGGADLANVTRHEDVVYQFTIFENQRWWMGLDWTAALLPQERPSWADESNNPVSPPSSFSLPPSKTTLKATPKSSDRNAYTKRIVRWQWIDPEWTVAGRDASTLVNGGAQGGIESQTSPGRRASTASGLSATSGSSEHGQSSGYDLIADASWLDVDAEGWQYGDNGWEKMSKKAGMGRYTRRRRWIRRAVLVELVQTDYHPTSDELAGQAVDVEKEKTDGKAPVIAGVPSSTSKGAQPINAEGNTLRDRLARAAANGGSVGTAQGNSLSDSSPSSPTADLKPEAGGKA